MANDVAANIHHMHEVARRMRGAFIEGSAWIEVLLTDIISHYFVSEKHRRLLFFSDVADAMSLYQKTTLLRKIFEHEFPELLVEYPKLSQRLSKFREFRNLLAHNHLDTSEAAIARRKPNEVLFVVYKRGRASTRCLTVEEVQKLADQVNKLRKELLAIQKQLFRRKKQL